jgi:ABC-type Fe3+ transport system substrate-binding protein
VDWIRTKPAMVTGPFLSILAKAPHPNAARLFVEWLFSPQGMQVWEETTGMGAAYPGMGTKQAKLLEGNGIPLIAETEEVVLQGIEMGLAERFSKALNIPQ